MPSTAGDEVLLAVARAIVGLSTRSAGALDGVSVTQLRAVTVLAERDGARLGDLAHELGVALSTASRLVDRLVRADLVDRAPAAHDRREVVLRVSSRGRAVLDRYDTARLADLRAMVDALPEPRRPAVLAALGEFAATARSSLGPDVVTADAAGRSEPGRAGASDGTPGGEPACLLHRVCPACGRMADEDPPTRCPGCGAELPAD